jgi:predicted nucleic-acid-binding protein
MNSIARNSLRSWKTRFAPASGTSIAPKPPGQHCASFFCAGKAGFAACLIQRPGREAGYEATVAFDQTAAKACGMRVLVESS